MEPPVRRKARPGAALVVIALLFGPIAPAAQAAGGTVRGTVTEAGSGAPLGAVTVRAFCWQVAGSNAGDICGETQTAIDGTYSLELAPGTYKAHFDKWPSHGAQYYGGGAHIADQDSLEVRVLDGSAVTGIDMALVPLRTLTGTVTGAGTAVGGINVTAYQRSPDTVPSWVPGRSTVTDAGGTYELHLPDGTYRVGFADAHGPYRTEFFDDAVTVDHADDIVVAGQHVAGIDADLALNHPITGTVTVDGVNMPGVRITAWQWVQGASGTSDWSDVKWTTSGDEGTYALYLPDGTYRVEFAPWQDRFPPVYYDGAATVGLANDVVVAGAEVPNIDAHIVGDGPDSGPAIRGTVTVAGGTEPALGAVVTAWRWNESAAGWDRARETGTGSDGTYALHVPEGTYRVGFASGSGRYQPVYYDGAEIIDAAADVVVSGEDALRIDASLVENHSISGTVTADPVEGLPPGVPPGTIVTAWRWDETTARWEAVTEVWAAPDGTYFMFVADGSYRIGFRNDEIGLWPPAYYDAATTIEEADDVVVAGADVANINGHLGSGGVGPEPVDPWPAAATLSEDGQDAWGPQVAVDGRGGATAVWYRWDGNHNRVQATIRAANGSWSSPVSLSSAGEDGWDPQVAVGPWGQAVVVWRQWTGTVYQLLAATRPSESGPWSAPAVLSAAGENAWDAEVAMGSQGQAVVVWRRWTGTGYQVRSSTRATAGGPWSAPGSLSAARGDAWGPQVAVGPDGTTVAAWSHSDGAEYRVQAATRSRGGSWSSPFALSPGGADAWDPQVAVGPGGTATVVWRRSAGGSDLIQAASAPQAGPWSTPASLSTPGGDAHSPQVAVDGDGVVTAVWSRWDGNADRVQAASLHPMGMWSIPQTLSQAGQTAHAPQVSSGPDGRATVVWRLVDGFTEWVEAATRRPDGSWPSPISVVGGSARAYGPQVATGADGTVAAVWEWRDGAYDRVQGAVVNPIRRTGGVRHGR